MSFISNEIAVRNQAWGAVQTSDEFIEFKAPEFAKYLNGVQNFLFESMLSAASYNKTMTFSTYERMTANHQPAEQLGYLADIFSHSSGLRLEPALAPIKIPRMQDERVNASDKVINPQELLTFLRSNNVSDLDDNSLDISFRDYRNLLKGIASAVT
jgi:hypothetical protein